MTNVKLILENGDAFELIKTIGDKSVDMVLTDPMYNLVQEQKEFLHEHFLRIARKSVCVFSPPENPWIIPSDQYLFWVKPISTKNTSRSYSRHVEQIFSYHCEEYQWNHERHWSQYTNVFHDLVDDTSLHPFRKPPALIERLIKNHTSVEDIVFDPFFGSGTTAEVCGSTQRNFHGFEIDVDIYSKSSKYLSDRWVVV